MSLDHSSHHHETFGAEESLGRRFIVGIFLNVAFVVIETVAGLMLGSLGLLTDAGHNLSDVAALALSLFAFKIAKKEENPRFTFGYRKVTIHVALINSLILLIATGAIGLEAFGRVKNPTPIAGVPMALVAGIGIVINSLTAWLFLRDKDRDLNVKGAYLHMAADALVSATVMVAGIVMAYTGWFWIDAAISFLVIIVIIKSTWGLFQDSIRLALDAVPQGIDVKSIQKKLASIVGVLNVHHIHIWPLSTTETAFTAHVTVKDGVDFKYVEEIKKNIREELHHAHIQHVTIEIDCE